MDLRPLLNDNASHIVLLVIDGLGGFADNDHGSELEEATTPNLDRLASEGSSGLLTPVLPGITPGSGPGHLALFGYDPLEHDLGRGVLSAVGVEFDLRPGDIAARGNLATLDEGGLVVDRRAGRIAGQPAKEVTHVLRERVSMNDVEVFFEHISQHRVLVVLRGEGLDPRIADLDPQRTGVPPRRPEARHPDAERTVGVLAGLDQEIRRALGDQPADVVLLRGFDTLRELPQMGDIFGVTPATVARYPMYRGVAKLVGMEALPKPHSLSEQVDGVRDHWDEYDYFFMHHKASDQAGHDGLRLEKIEAIESVDTIIPDLMDLHPDVLVVTGDHSSPTQLSGHSWHPVPTVMWGPRVGRDGVVSFGERAAASGLLGHRHTKDLMPIMLAAAGRLERYGA